MSTTVATPRKCPGLTAPSYRVPISPASTDVEKSGRIHGFTLGSEHEVYAGLLELTAIACEVPGVSREVFARAELQRIDEERDGNGPARCARRARDELEMAPVERAHGRNEPERPGHGSERGTRRKNGIHDLHEIVVSALGARHP